MAPVNKNLHTIEDDATILHEIIAVRNTMQLAQQALSRIEHRLSIQRRRSVITDQIQQGNVSSRQSSITPTKDTKPICWYHRRHGAATNPANCPGPSACEFKTPPAKEINKRTKPLVTKKNVATPAQSDVPVARVPSRPVRPGSQTKLAQAKETPINVSSPAKPSMAIHMPTGNSPQINQMDWAAQIPEKANLSQELENELLNMSN